MKAIAVATDVTDKAAIEAMIARVVKDLGRIELTGHGHHFAFDRTGKRLAVSNWDTTATLYDLETALKPMAPK